MFDYTILSYMIILCYIILQQATFYLIIIYIRNDVMFKTDVYKKILLKMETTYYKIGSTENYKALINPHSLIQKNLSKHKGLFMPLSICLLLKYTLDRQSTLPSIVFNNTGTPVIYAILETKVYTKKWDQGIFTNSSYGHLN